MPCARTGGPLPRRSASGSTLERKLQTREVTRFVRVRAPFQVLEPGAAQIEVPAEERREVRDEVFGERDVRIEHVPELRRGRVVRQYRAPSFHVTRAPAASGTRRRLRPGVRARAPAYRCAGSALPQRRQSRATIAASGPACRRGAGLPSSRRTRRSTIPRRTARMERWTSRPKSGSSSVSSCWSCSAAISRNDATIAARASFRRHGARCDLDIGEERTHQTAAATPGVHARGCAAVGSVRTSTTVGLPLASAAWSVAARSVGRSTRTPSHPNSRAICAKSCWPNFQLRSASGVSSRR